MKTALRCFVLPVLLVVLCLAAADRAGSAPLRVPAFPGAEGYGACAKGGRGGKVLFVTNLEDYNPEKEKPIPGSLRAACMAKGPRIVIFRVSGTIHLKTTLLIEEPYLTLAGQTAPGDGICVRGQQVHIATHDVVVRHMRFRCGDEWGRKNKKPFSPDALGIRGRIWVAGQKLEDAPRDQVVRFITLKENNKYLNDPDTEWNFEARDIIIDHCSVSWGVDETLAVTHSDNVTVQWCVVAEGLSVSTHGAYHKGFNHSCGLMVAYMVPHVTLHHNLIMHCWQRNPYPQTEWDYANRNDVVNNIVYNFTYSAGIGYKKTNTRGEFNFVGNYCIPGPQTRAKKPCLLMGVPARIYARGNIGMFRTDPKQDEYAAIHWFGKWAKGYDISRLKAKEPFEVPPVTTHSYLAAYKHVLAGVGATRPKRDPVDTRLVREVKTRKGRHINQAADVGGWPELKSAPAPKDTDNDGMPDAWETKYGLNPKDASDNVGDKDKDGYTNIEECINETDPTTFVDYRKPENNVDSLRRADGIQN